MSTRCLQLNTPLEVCSGSITRCWEYGELLLVLIEFEIRTSATTTSRLTSLAMHTSTSASIPSTSFNRLLRFGPGQRMFPVRWTGGWCMLFFFDDLCFVFFSNLLLLVPIECIRCYSDRAIVVRRRSVRIWWRNCLRMRRTSLLTSVRSIQVSFLPVSWITS